MFAHIVVIGLPDGEGHISDWRSAWHNLDLTATVVVLEQVLVDLKRRLEEEQKDGSLSEVQQGPNVSG